MELGLWWEKGCGFQRNTTTSLRHHPKTFNNVQARVIFEICWEFLGRKLRLKTKDSQYNSWMRNLGFKPHLTWGSTHPLGHDGRAFAACHVTCDGDICTSIAKCSRLARKRPPGHIKDAEFHGAPVDNAAKCHIEVGRGARSATGFRCFCHEMDGGLGSAIHGGVSGGEERALERIAQTPVNGRVAAKISEAGRLPGPYTIDRWGLFARNACCCQTQMQTQMKLSRTDFLHWEVQAVVGDTCPGGEESGEMMASRQVEMQPSRPIRDHKYPVQLPKRECRWHSKTLFPCVVRVLPQRPSLCSHAGYQVTCKLLI